MKNPGKFFKNNLANSLQLIEATVQAGVKQTSSTAAIFATNDAPLAENMIRLTFMAIQSWR